MKEFGGEKNLVSTVIATVGPFGLFRNSALNIIQRSQPLLQRWVLSDCTARGTIGTAQVSTVIATVGPFGLYTHNIYNKQKFTSRF